MRENWVIWGGVVFSRFLSLILLERCLDAGFKLWIQIGLADFTGWMPFLQCNLIKDISPFS